MPSFIRATAAHSFEAVRAEQISGDIDVKTLGSGILLHGTRAGLVASIMEKGLYPGGVPKAQRKAGKRQNLFFSPFPKEDDRSKGLTKEGSDIMVAVNARDAQDAGIRFFKSPHWVDHHP